MLLHAHSVSGADDDFPFPTQQNAVPFRIRFLELAAIVHHTHDLDKARANVALLRNVVEEARNVTEEQAEHCDRL